ncbi:hypothetical protein DFS34DRAFT_403781 [Phlyctochytrium arcticum]|nr:hypothetical protein DFS34DRAFT_403781 [Phlyctochytrium arcticum]
MCCNFFARAMLAIAIVLAGGGPVGPEFQLETCGVCGHWMDIISRSQLFLVYTFSILTITIITPFARWTPLPLGCTWKALRDLKDRLFGTPR